MSRHEIQENARVDRPESESGKRSVNIDIVQLLNEGKHNTRGAACVQDANDGYIHCGPIVGIPAPVESPNHDSQPLPNTLHQDFIPQYQNR